MLWGRRHPAHHLQSGGADRKGRERLCVLPLSGSGRRGWLCELFI